MYFTPHECKYEEINSVGNVERKIHYHRYGSWVTNGVLILSFECAP